MRHSLTSYCISSRPSLLPPPLNPLSPPPSVSPGQHRAGVEASRVVTYEGLGEREGREEEIRERCYVALTRTIMDEGEGVEPGKGVVLREVRYGSYGSKEGVPVNQAVRCYFVTAMVPCNVYIEIKESSNFVLLAPPPSSSPSSSFSSPEYVNYTDFRSSRSVITHLGGGQTVHLATVAPSPGAGPVVYRAKIKAKTQSKNATVTVTSLPPTLHCTYCLSPSPLPSLPLPPTPACPTCLSHLSTAPPPHPATNSTPYVGFHTSFSPTDSRPTVHHLPSGGTVATQAAAEALLRREAGAPPRGEKNEPLWEGIAEDFWERATEFAATEFAKAGGKGGGGPEGGPADCGPADWSTRWRRRYPQTIVTSSRLLESSLLSSPHSLSSLPTSPPPPPSSPPLKRRRKTATFVPDDHPDAGRFEDKGAANVSVDLPKTNKAAGRDDDYSSSYSSSSSSSSSGVPPPAVPPPQKSSKSIAVSHHQHHQHLPTDLTPVLKVDNLTGGVVRRFSSLSEALDEANNPNMKSNIRQVSARGEGHELCYAPFPPPLSH